MSARRIATLALLACCAVPAAGAAPAGPAAAYIEHALGLMEAHSIHRARIDWPALRTTVLAAAADAGTTQETYPALRLGLELLGDRHSALIPAEQAPAFVPRAHNAATASHRGQPSARLLDGAIGYLHVPGHAGGDPRADRVYAETLQQLIQRVDAAAPCAWIVDLRGNPGGNMWPMLAGLQPLLGAGEVGAFHGADGNVTRWWVDAGTAGSGTMTQAASRYAYTLRRAVPPVAVVTGAATASSGEAVAVAFRGRARTRSFGVDTLGVSTGNRGFVLADGALLFVTASRFADRDGVVYGGVVEPDVVTPEPEAVAAAARWLRGQPACTGGHATDPM